MMRLTTILGLFLTILAVAYSAPLNHAMTNTTSNITYAVVSNADEYESMLFNRASLSAARDNFVYIQDTSEVCSQNANTRKQYCVKITSVVHTFMDSIGAPLTACLDSTFGEGGSTSKQVSIEIGISSGSTVGLSDTTVSAISVSGGVTVSSSVSFSLSNSCDVTKGNIVQMWGFPFYTHAKMRYRTMKTGKRLGLAKWSAWSNEKDVTFPTRVGPETRCVGSVNEAICGSHPVKSKFVAPGGPIVDDM